jgi:hypothetical protein
MYPEIDDGNRATEGFISAAALVSPIPTAAIDGSRQMNAILRTVLRRLALGVVTLFVVSALISLRRPAARRFRQAILGRGPQHQIRRRLPETGQLDRGPVGAVNWIGGACAWLRDLLRQPRQLHPAQWSR